MGKGGCWNQLVLVYIRHCGRIIILPSVFRMPLCFPSISALQFLHGSAMDAIWEATAYLNCFLFILLSWLSMAVLWRQWEPCVCIPSKEMHSYWRLRRECRNQTSSNQDGFHRKLHEVKFSQELPGFYSLIVYMFLLLNHNLRNRFKATLRYKNKGCVMPWLIAPMEIWYCCTLNLWQFWHWMWSGNLGFYHPAFELVTFNSFFHTLALPLLVTLFVTVSYALYTFASTILITFIVLCVVLQLLL